MRRTVLFVFLLGVFAFAVIPAACAEETKTLLGDFLTKANVQVSGSTSYYSQYIWRGIRLDDDGVLQPSLTVSAFNGWALNVWGSFDVENEDALNSDEVDTTLSYTRKFEDLEVAGIGLKPVIVTLGHIYYDFPGTDTFSRETMLGLGYEILLNPSFTWYHDYGKESQGGGKGDYYMLALSQSVPVLPDYGITLDLSGHAGYNDNLYISGVGGDILLSAGLTIPLTKSAKLQPSVNWSTPSGDVSHENAGNYNDEFFMGVTLSYAL